MDSSRFQQILTLFQFLSDEKNIHWNTIDQEPKAKITETQE